MFCSSLLFLCLPDVSPLVDVTSNKEALKLKEHCGQINIPEHALILELSSEFFFDQNGCKQVAVSAFFPLKESKTEG